MTSEIKDIRNGQITLVYSEVARFFSYIRDNRTNSYLEQLILFFQSGEEVGKFYILSPFFTQHNHNHEEVRKYMLDNYNVEMEYLFNEQGKRRILLTLSKNKPLTTTIKYKNIVFKKDNSYFVDRMSAHCMDIEHEIKKHKLNVEG